MDTSKNQISISFAQGANFGLAFGLGLLMVVPFIVLVGVLLMPLLSGVSEMISGAVIK